MKLNIIITYRPLSRGALNCPLGEIRQLSDGRWMDSTGDCKYSSAYRPGGEEYEKDELVRAIKFINKNSHFRHNIIVVIDKDVFPNDIYLKEFDNVKILKSNYDDSSNAFYRTYAEIRETVNTIPDEELICCIYNSDFICGKDWDKYIFDAMQQYGDDKHIYVPLIVDVRDWSPYGIKRGTKVTADLIWNVWRNDSRIPGTWHILVMPEPEVGYFTEKDMEEFTEASNKSGNVVIVENPGARQYGYICSVCTKAKLAKAAFKIAGTCGESWDLHFDDAFFHVGVLKAVVCKSLIFHPQFTPFKYETK